MLMRHEFPRTAAIEIRPEASEKQDRAIRDNRIVIDEIGEASARIIADYPDLARWFCLRVRNMCEFSVEKLLREAGILACVPRRKGEQKLHRGRMLPAPVLPVIPGYLLVRCVPSNAAFRGLLHIDRKKRVIDLVRNGERPHAISDRFIKPFMELAAAGGYDERPASVRWKGGTKVRVIDGPFASFPGVVVGVVETAGQCRINVEVNIFGRPTPVELDIAQIEKV